MSVVVDYPVCLRLRGRRVLVVGAGVVAAQRVAGLLEAGAVVTVVAEEVRAGVSLQASPQIRVIERAFVDSDVDDAELVFVAINDAEVSAHIVAVARARGLLVNAADIPALCDFTLPSVGRDGPITVAVSTSGRAPALARRLKDLLMAQVPKRHGDVIRVVHALRRRLPSGPARMQFIRCVVDGDVGAALLAGERRRAFALLRDQLEHVDGPRSSDTSFTSTTHKVSL